ncbi:hypothetical protein BD779DRAFT_1641909 [Infundibulicybe gibba]|nr:hypothetical protein BD779DRAFT_1641909 [Infundibulicybe gibba]
MSHFYPVVVCFLVHFKPVAAHSPLQEILPWPPSLLLLAATLYTALGVSPDILWCIEPAIGLLLGSGLPSIAIPAMQRTNWVANACHFVADIKTAYGKSNFWVPGRDVTSTMRAECLRKTLDILSPVVYEQPEFRLDQSLWRLNSAGLFEAQSNPPSLSPPLPFPSSTQPIPSARDFLLFSAIHYHAFWEWEVEVEWKGSIAFSTKGTDARAIFDVHDEQMALPIVAAQLVRRPYSQSHLRAAALEPAYGVYRLNLDHLSRTSPVCSIDFHSYASPAWKVSGSLYELAGAYFRVVQYIKQLAPKWSTLGDGPVAHVHVGQTLWIAILGGAVLDSGRLTIQNLPGRWAMRGVSPDEAYDTRVKSILHAIEPYANKKSFGDLVFSGGSSRTPALPMLVMGIIGQTIVCYLLAACTPASLWMSVALANLLFAGKLTDWHSMYWGKTETSEEPGMKMYVPKTKRLMAIATFDRTPPREGALRPGILLNACGAVAAILGAVFQNHTRSAVGVGLYEPTPPWVLNTCIILGIGISVIIGATVMFQQSRERTWRDDSELPTRWMVYATLSCSVVVGVLALTFHATLLKALWPLLDALLFVSGLPFGSIENGRMVAGDDSIIHILLINRWLVGVTISALRNC